MLSGAGNDPLLDLGGLTIPVHPAAAAFPPMSDDELVELGEDIKEHGLKQPLWFYSEARRPKTIDRMAEAIALQNTAMRQARDRQLPLLDGRNRLMAMQRVGMLNEAVLKDLLQRAKICYADETTPEEFVMSANVHRRHLTPDDKRKLIAALLKANPERSDRATAKIADSNRTTVGQIRRDLEQKGDVSIIDTRTDSAGRQQPATKPPKPPSKEAQIRALREGRELEARSEIPNVVTRTDSAGEPPTPPPMPDLDELKSVLAMLRGDPARIANLSLEKRVALARVCLAFLNLTVADLRPGAA
jgi:ParB-like chromosome segregation protein Spo0J